MITIDDLRAQAVAATIPDGEPLTPLEFALIRFGVASSVTSLDTPTINEAIAAALKAGGTPDQVQEILSLVSGLGMHSLMASSVAIITQARAAGFEFADTLSAEQQALWDKHVGADPFWIGFELELPGFLRAMLQLSANQFVAFFAYCAVPWQNRHVRAKVKELTAMACDATPAHRFLPGFKVHLANAVALGAGRLAVEETLTIATAAQDHRGTA